jgi:hypothetical protein
MTAARGFGAGVALERLLLLGGPTRALAGQGLGRGAGRRTPDGAPNDLRCLAVCAELSAGRARPAAEIGRIRAGLGATCAPNRARFER